MDVTFLFMNIHLISAILTERVNLPPVSVEDTVTKAQQFSNNIEARMEEPIEEYEPN